MSADSSSLMPMWSWAILRKPLNHWSGGSLSGRLECHSSGWIPDLTRCEAIQGFRILSSVSECLGHEDQSSLNFKLSSFSQWGEPSRCLLFPDGNDPRSGAKTVPN